MKHVVLVTRSRNTGIALREQLSLYLDDRFDLKVFSLDSPLPDALEADLLILSGPGVKEELERVLTVRCREYLTAGRTISCNRIEELVTLPAETRVLLVSDKRESAEESIRELQELGLDNLRYEPWSPDRGSGPVRADIAVTVGEQDKIPGSIGRFIDLGPRIIDSRSMTRILLSLNLNGRGALSPEKAYLKKILQIARNQSLLREEISHLQTQQAHVFEALREGLIAYDSDGGVSFSNEKFRTLFHTAGTLRQDVNIRDLVTHKLLVEFLLSAEEEKGRVFRIGGKEVFVRKFRLGPAGTWTASFKSLSEIEKTPRLKQELIQRGYYAKHHFVDMIGGSPSMKIMKRVAEKLAVSSLTVLIEGESGTGKELLASSIHNASRRSSRPFIALNLSSINDELLESELFGYEEGAFTGARKNGRPGLFEQADGGTLFLDEIGDITPKLQKGLLRALQEQEIMRIGGDRIIKVNVRVIAATNRDLFALVREGRFREDLYYRLKRGYLKLPPLRERREDLPLLIRHLIETGTSEPVAIDPPLMERLTLYPWPGNIREMENVLSYLLAVRESDRLSVADLSEHLLPAADHPAREQAGGAGSPLSRLTGEHLRILFIIRSLQESGRIPGRENISDVSGESGPLLPVSRVRARLAELEQEGLILRKKGRHGTVLTLEGRRFLEETAAGSGYPGESVP